MDIISSVTEEQITLHKPDLKNPHLNRQRIIDLNPHIVGIAKLLNTDHNTVDFRIQECLSEGGVYLDLNDLGLKTLPVIPDSVEHLFCANNNLTEINITTNLLTLDCSHNNLTQFSYLPPSLTELCCRGNQLTRISLSRLPNLRVLDCSNNQVLFLSTSDTLEVLYCDSNCLSGLPSMSKLRVLSCSNNQITTLGSYPLLNELECSHNKLKILRSYPELRGLFCEANQITNLVAYPMLHVLCCHTNSILEMPYYPMLFELTCDESLSRFAAEYKCKDHMITSDHIRYLAFELKE